MLKSLKQVGLQFLFLLAFYSLVRIFFLAYNWSGFDDFDQSEIISSLILGLRFDASSILMMNLPFFLYWLYPSQRHRGLSLKIFLFVNVLFLAVNIADFELIRFNGRRLTPFYFVMAQDVGDQIGQLFVHFWYLTLGLLLAGLALAKFFPRPVRLDKKTPLYQVLALYLLFLPLWLVGVRGGLQSRPVREANAFVFSSPKLGNLSLNSSFTFIYARKSALGRRYEFFAEAELDKYINTFTGKPSQLHGRLRGSNVMLIIMESFGLEYMGAVNGREGYTPFLDELSEKGLFFKNAYANGRRSIDSVPSVLAGLPSLMKEPFLLSGQQNIEILGYPKVLSDLGYSTHFYHGAKNGTMFFDSFTERIGVTHYSGLNEYPADLKDQNYDGYWGIWDEPYFKFVGKEIGGFSKPFFTTLFSLSAHQPYTLPAGMENKFPAGNMDILKTVAYSDYSLREFFKSIEKESWFSNTLFIITADHTSDTSDAVYANSIGEYRIPIIFYHPSFNSWPSGVDQKIFQQVDIMPTVLDLLGVQENRMSTGRTAFVEGDRFVTNRIAGSYWYVDKRGVARMNFKGEMTESHGDPVSENIFRAYVQYVVNGVNNNKLVKPASASE